MASMSAVDGAAFGRAARGEFMLLDDVTFVNHGSVRR